MKLPPRPDRPPAATAALRAAAGTLLALALAGFASAQTAPVPAAAPANPAAPAANSTASSATPTTTSDVVTLSAFEVKGYINSLQESLDTKRASDDNVDVITAQDEGTFPDLNLAEALSHLPGVTTDRLFGEGERVSILGTDPNLNRTLFNGEPISSADWYVLDNQSRQFDYLLISPDVIGQATVYRTWEPRLLEGSIGGTINVNTRDPMDLAPLSFTGTLTDSYDDRSTQSEGSESAMFSWHNADKTVAVLIGGQDERDFLRRDGVEALSEDNQTNFAVAGAGTIKGLPTTPFVTDEVVNSALFLQLRHHQGGNTTIEFKPNDQLTIDLTGLYVKQTMNNVNFSWYIYPGDNWSGLPNATNATVSNGVLSNYTINSAPLVVDAFNRAAQIITQDYDAKATYKGDNYTLVANAGDTRATGGTQHQFFAENFIFANANVNENASQASFAVTGAPGDPSGAGVNNGADFSTLGAGNFYGNIASNPEVDDQKWFQLDLDVPLKGALQHLFAGARVSDEKAGQTGEDISVPNAGSVSTNLAALGLTGAPSNFLAGLPDVTSSMSQHLVANSYGGVANFVSNLSASGLAGATPGENLLTYFNSAPPSDAAVFTSTPTFTIDEQISAAYAEGQFSAGELDGNFGARFVDTTTTSASYNLSTPGAPTLITQKDSYSNVLPAVNLVYNLSDNQLFRFGVAQVIARPNTSSEANWVSLYDSTLSGVGGNTGLKPYESTNTDLDYEYYFGKNSYVSADVFYKDISNYIINAAAPEVWTDYSLPGDPMETYEISRPSNGGAATSQGIAFSYQQELPCGLGIQANYTRLHTSSANGPLPFSSKDQVNLSPFFENHWGLLRLTYGWRDDYASSSFNGTSTVFTAPYTELDANATINLTKTISIELAGINLLDETYRQYYQTNNGPSLFADAYKFGRTYEASLHWAF